MRVVSSPSAGRVRSILLAMLAVMLSGWLLLTAPAQVERFTAGHAPDAGMQLADGGPGIGAGGGGGG